jgi:hypothetical protein
VTAFHLAQLNIGRLLAPLDSEQMSGFVAALEPINALADSAPGFVWRLQTEAGDATALRVFDDDMLIVNMSVWESREALSQFVFRSAHREVLTGRRQWFERIDDDYLVLWWVAAGHIPEVDEAKARLSLLQKEGPSPEAFTFRSVFPAPDATP